MKEPESFDERLALCLARAGTGQATAFEEFYDATVGHARALARRMVNAADVPDLLADAYFAAWRQAARFDPQRGSAVAWLLMMVRSRALDLLRHQRSQRTFAAGDELPDVPSGAPDPSEQLRPEAACTARWPRCRPTSAGCWGWPTSVTSATRTSRKAPACRWAA